MKSISNAITKWLRSRIPTRPVGVYDFRSDPSSLAPTLDVDRVHAIISNAEAGNTSDLFALYRDHILTDSHSQSEFTKRKLALLGDPPNIIPVNDKNPDDVRAADFIRKAVDGCTNWLAGLSALLDSTLWPVSVVEKVFEARRTPEGRSVYMLKSLRQVPYELLDYQTGRMRLKNLTPEGRPDSTTSPIDPQRYIVHRGHLLSTPDNWGGPMRSILFWWLLSTMDRGWWAQFLERFGNPFLVGKYDQNDDQSREVLERAFSLSKRVGGLVVTRQTEVDIREALQRGGDGFEKFHIICQREKSKLILGQTLSSEAQATGMGSGVAAIQSEVRQDIRQFDGAITAQSVRDQLFRQLLDINRIPGATPKLTFGGVSSAEAKTFGALLRDLFDSGYRVKDEALAQLSEKVGLPVERVPESMSRSFFSQTLSDPIRRREDFAPDQIARTGAAPLSQAFREADAEVWRIMRDSRSPDECIERVRSYLVAKGVPISKADEILEQALTAYMADGAVMVPDEGE